MFSAISFGVFCRAAPSTRLIIRSMKVLPGSVVIRTTMRSESTLVPPVTALRSPPDSRMTGADSPVIADSSTDATPSTTSPSPGMTSPASQTTRSPTRRAVPGTVPPSTRRATVSVLALRSVSACALPRPSATASARLAKSTVSQSQALIVQPNQSPGSLKEKTVVSTEPIHTTNITGDVTITLGSSLRNASGSDASSCAGLRTPAPDGVEAVGVVAADMASSCSCTRVVIRRALRPAGPGPARGSR